MNLEEHYEKVDMPYYQNEISPRLPEKVLDFHTHIWKKDQWLQEISQYMTTTLDYDINTLLKDGDAVFPDKEYHAVVFGHPTPTTDNQKTNAYVAEQAENKRLYPLHVTGKDLLPPAELKKKMIEPVFYGYKVYLNWDGNNYADVGVADMLGPAEMEIANELGLIVLLHVPRSGRLADPEVGEGVRKYAKEYPNAHIVLAHCGRCYRYKEIKTAIHSIKDLDNVYLDTSMVTNPMVMQVIFNNISASRIFYATDFPVAAMRGRRVEVMDHWVDVVLDVYPDSEFRVQGNNIHASYMAYEIIRAIEDGAEIAGIPESEVKDIYWNNGMNLLKKVKK